MFMLTAMGVLPMLAFHLGLAAGAAPAPVNHEAILRERVNTLIPQAMKTQGVDLWLTFTRENTTDPLLATLGLDHIVARGAFIFILEPGGKFRKVAIAASYDVEPIERGGLYDQVIAYKKEGIKPHLLEVIKKADPARIAVNYSRDVTVADGLTVGMRAYLDEALGDLTKRFVSSEKVVVSLLGRKVPQEIAALREAAEATQRIINEALSGQVRPGVTTENALNDWMTGRARELGCDVAFSSIVVGPSRGHSDPTDRVIQRGDVIRFDWGASFGGYSADIQRTAYVLKEGETAAPGWLEKLWQDSLAANRAAMAACRPGNTGNDVDRAGRTALTSRGYDEYPHGTGHAIGLKVHDVGPMLGPDWRERYGDPVFFKIEAGQVFAIEPLIYIKPPELGYDFHVGLEEDVVVDETGAHYLTPPQTELILVR
ncbi:MAG TPA: M24 family metallopeptidase [Candidatus Polarisedimenticolia bacterium]|nr:M24 family metallopeptidase [Candidatus Polarisedimenticolia bacterium]